MMYPGFFQGWYTHSVQYIALYYGVHRIIALILGLGLELSSYIVNNSVLLCTQVFSGIVYSHPIQYNTLYFGVQRSIAIILYRIRISALILYSK